MVLIRNECTGCGVQGLSHRCYIDGVGEATIRELRNQGAKVMARVAAGERITVTCDGQPVAQLHPLPRRPLVASALHERFKRLPPIDPARFRADIDEAIDQSL